MRIGIVTTWLERGASYVSRQYKELLENKHDVFIYARGGEGYAIGDSNWDNQSVTWGKKIPLGVPMSIDLADFKKWILDNKIETIFFNEQQWWPPVLLANQLGIKTGAYVDYYTKETVQLFANYDFLICNTKRHLSVFSWHKGTKYIPWGTNINLFKPQHLEPVENDVVTFFHSCGVSPERKGTDLLIQAFNRIKDSAKLVIHTQTSIKKHYIDLSDIIDNLTNSGRLTIVEKTVSAPGLYHLGDIYVYPSRLEGIGLTLSEALSCGLPLITSDNPPMNEFVSTDSGKVVKINHMHDREDGYYWLQCEVDIIDLVQKMQFYIDNINDLSNFKKSAREYAKQNLDWNKNEVDILDVFKNVKKLSVEEKKEAKESAIEYEKKRSTLRAKLYSFLPFLFKPFSWFWFLIKRRYITH